MQLTDDVEGQLGARFSWKRYRFDGWCRWSMSILTPRNAGSTVHHEFRDVVVDTSIRRTQEIAALPLHRRSGIHARGPTHACPGRLVSLLVGRGRLHRRASIVHLERRSWLEGAEFVASEEATHSAGNP